MLSEHIDLDNLHHAYLLEGEREILRVEIKKFASGLKKSEIIEIATDAFKIEDARNLKSLGAEKSLSEGKKVFIISVNSILREAQNAMLKLFEEPIPEAHFFLLVPDASSLIPTLRSRFYVISNRGQTASADESADAEKFLSLPLTQRIDFVKEKIGKFDDEENITDSARAEAQRFLNSLEVALGKKLIKNTSDVNSLEHIWKTREILRMPGSSVKNLLESIALVVPVLK